MNTELKSYEIPWIPVAERLPTPAESREQTTGLNILITVEDEQGNKEVSIGFYNHFCSEFKDLRAWYDRDLDENNGAIEEPFMVTAWAPLPAAYSMTLPSDSQHPAGGFVTDPTVHEVLEGLLSIVDESKGVAGYHLNGEIAEWGEFEEVNTARMLISKIRGER